MLQRAEELTNLGDDLYASGYFEEAEFCFRKALDMFSILGGANADARSASEGLCRIYEALGREDDARRVCPW